MYPIWGSMGGTPGFTTTHSRLKIFSRELRKHTRNGHFGKSSGWIRTRDPRITSPTLWPQGYATSAAEPMENLCYLCSGLLMYTVASPDPNPRGGGQLPNPNECNSTLTSVTRGTYPYPDTYIYKCSLVVWSLDKTEKNVWPSISCLFRQTEDFHPKVTVDQAEGLLVGLTLKLGRLDIETGAGPGALYYCIWIRLKYWTVVWFVKGW